MINREYYPLEMASEIIDCSVDDLLYLGASGKITIHAMTNGLFGRLSKFDTTTGAFKTEGIFRLPDVSEIPSPTLLALANRQTWYIKTVSLTGKGKFLCTLFDYDEQVLFWSAPFARAENDFNEKMYLEHSSTESIIEIKDFVLTHSELEKAKTLNSNLAVDTAYPSVTEGKASDTPPSNAIESESSQPLNNVQTSDKKTPSKPEAEPTNIFSSSEWKSKNERDYLYRTIGALVLLLIEKTQSAKFGTREKPNKSAIYGAVQQLLSDMGYKTEGQTKSTLNDVIKEALNITMK